MIQYQGMILDGPMAGQFVASESAVYVCPESLNDPILPPTEETVLRQHVVRAFTVPFVDHDGQRNSICFFIDNEAAGDKPWLHVFKRLTELASAGEKGAKVIEKLKQDHHMTAEEFLKR